MAFRNIIKDGDPILRRKSRDVTEFNDKLAILLDDMAETMYDADGVGLAAPQVGINRNVVVIDVGEGLIEMVNPVITATHGKQRGVEGCLSVPNVHGEVERPARLTAEFYDRDGKKCRINADGLLAVCICHELDHLVGILFTDKMEQ